MTRETEFFDWTYNGKKNNILQKKNNNSFIWNTYLCYDKFIFNVLPLRRAFLSNCLAQEWDQPREGWERESERNRERKSNKGNCSEIPSHNFQGSDPAQLFSSYSSSLNFPFSIFKFSNVWLEQFLVRKRKTNDKEWKCAMLQYH
jgi:hypothetical protein